MNVIDIEGAQFVESERPSWTYRHQELSANGSLLGRIYEVQGETFRVLFFRRGLRDYQLIGEWWGEVGDPVITDSLEEAKKILSEHVAAAQ